MGPHKAGLGLAQVPRCERPDSDEDDNNVERGYPASEEAEIIRLVEQSHLPVRRTLEKLGIPTATFYRWYDLHRTGGPEALGDRSPRPGRVWNRIPEEIRGQIIDLALEQPELASRELAGRFTHERQDFLSEAAGYPLLKGPDPIPSPAHK